MWSSQIQGGWHFLLFYTAVWGKNKFYFRKRGRNSLRALNPLRMVSYLSASIVISRRLPFLTSISLSRPRNDIAHDTVCTIQHNWALSHRLFSTGDELNWESLNLNQAASKWHQRCPRRVFKCGCHEHHTHNLAAPASGRLLLRCAAYFWANLPKLRLCSTPLYSIWPLTNPTLSVTREGAAVRCCTEARGTNSSKVSAAGDAIWEISCWVSGVEKKRGGLGKWKLT